MLSMIIFVFSIVLVLFTIDYILDYFQQESDSLSICDKADTEHAENSPTVYGFSHLTVQDLRETSVAFLKKDLS